MKYKKIDLAQGSKEWLDWRLTHITASDVPCLFNKNPYKKVSQLFDEKLGIWQEKISDYKQKLFDKGHHAEKLGREYLLHIGNPMFPMVVESIEYPFLGASLDGINEISKTIAEFKYMGAISLGNTLKCQTIKTNHLIQIQAQLAVTGFEECLYFVMDGHQSGMISIKRNQDLIEEIIEKSDEFMKEVRSYENK